VVAAARRAPDGAVSVSVRRARPADVPFLAALVTHPGVAPYLAAVRPSTPAEIAPEVARSLAEPEAAGVFVVERDGEPVGTVSFERTNRRSRIADLHSLAVHPDARGDGTACAALALFLDVLFDELDFHRVECEVYGFNERAAAFFASAGLVAEGTRRKAYLRDGEWVDGLRFGLLAEERPGRPPP
jgi:RimJ/RimL family protein N-acetyltransferase